MRRCVSVFRPPPRVTLTNDSERDDASAPPHPRSVAARRAGRALESAAAPLPDHPLPRRGEAVAPSRGQTTTRPDRAGRADAGGDLMRLKLVTGWSDATETGDGLSCARARATLCLRLLRTRLMFARGRARRRPLPDAREEGRVRGRRAQAAARLLPVRAQPARDAIGRRRLRRAGAWWSVCAVSGALPRPPGPTRVGDDGDDDARSHTGRRTRDGGGRVSARRRGRLNAKNHLGPKGNYGGYAFCSQFLAHDMCVCHRCRLVRVVSLHARRGGASVARAARRSERAARRARTGRLRMARSLDAPSAPPRPFGWLVSRHAPTATATAGGGRAASSRVVLSSFGAVGATSRIVPFRMHGDPPRPPPPELPPSSHPPARRRRRYFKLGANGFPGALQYMARLDEVRRRWCARGAAPSVSRRRRRTISSCPGHPPPANTTLMYDLRRREYTSPPLSLSLHLSLSLSHKLSGVRVGGGRRSASRLSRPPLAPPPPVARGALASESGGGALALGPRAATGRAARRAGAQDRPL